MARAGVRSQRLPSQSQPGHSQMPPATQNGRRRRVEEEDEDEDGYGEADDEDVEDEGRGDGVRVLSTRVRPR